MRDHHRPAVLSLLFSMLCIGAAANSNAQCAEGWLPGSGIPGVTHVGESIVWDDGSGPALYLFVSDYTIAGDQFVNKVMRFDGQTYEQVGSGLTGHVFACAVFDGALIAAGHDLEIDGVDVDHVVRFDGSNWQPMSANMPSATVRTLMVYDGELYAGGDIHPQYDLMRWDGLMWQPVNGAPANTVWTLGVWQDRLVVAGGPATYGEGKEQFSGRIGTWDGESWQSFSGSTNGTIRAMKTLGDDLIVAGSITEAGGINVSYVARWNGSNWQALGDGLPQEAWSLAIFQDEVYAGLKSTNGGGLTNLVMRWTDRTWEAVHGPNQFLHGDIETLSVFNDCLYYGGGYSLLLFENDVLEAHGIAAWDGAKWARAITPLHSPVSNGAVLDLTLVNGEWHASGAFSILEDSYANGIARWDGENWQPLGEGVNATIHDVVAFQGDLIAAGRFTEAGGQSVNYIARWDGQNWHSLGEGLDDRVLDLTVYEGDLIACGRFTTAGGQPSRFVARWDGAAWHPMQANLSGNSSHSGYVVHVYDGALLLGGVFSYPYGLTAWDGDSWEPFAGGVNYGALCMGEIDGDLVIGGLFTEVGASKLSAQHIARFDGTGWHAYGDGLDEHVWSVFPFEGDLIASGLFENSGSTPMRFIARWNGAIWEEMDGGMDNVPHAFAVMNGQLVVGGYQLTAGDVISRGLVRWGMMCEGTLAPLTDLQIVFGQQLSGDLDSLREDDDDVLRVRSALGFSAVEPNITRFRVGAMNEVENASGINLAITARINHPTGVAKVRLKNWKTNHYTIVAEYTLTNVESTESIVEIDATDFIRASDDRLEVDHQIVVAAVFSALGFDAMMERVGVETF